MKIVINPSYGGFHPNYKIMMRYAELKGIKLYAAIDSFVVNKRVVRPYNGEPLENQWEEDYIDYFTEPILKEREWGDWMDTGIYYPWYDIPRNDPALAQAVEEAGNRANLVVVEIPDDVEWEIEEYDGAEWVSEKHRTWR